MRDCSCLCFCMLLCNFPTFHPCYKIILFAYMSTLLKLLLHPFAHRYNMFWNSFEVSPSRDAAFACPPEAVAIPATELQRVAQGYHRFHCYAKTRLAQFDTIFDLDSDIGAQSAAILYSAPAFYRHPNCTGFVFGKDVIKGGCAPMDAHMDDYEDYVLMLARRYTERGLKHFVVWNEVASAGWMDM